MTRRAPEQLVLDTTTRDGTPVRRTLHLEHFVRVLTARLTQSLERPLLEPTTYRSPDDLRLWR
jgi:hypothetical protein